VSIEDEDEPCDVTRCRGCSYCSDTYGVDAVKDANAEAGREPYHEQGHYDAQRNGWFRGPTY
jgi:MinD superfamily P-loop ATPase